MYTLKNIYYPSEGLFTIPCLDLIITSSWQGFDLSYIALVRGNKIVSEWYHFWSYKAMSFRANDYKVIQVLTAC